MNSNFIELNGICGSKCFININEIADIREQNVLGRSCTIILYSSGKKLIVNRAYEEVKHLIMRGANYQHENMKDFTQSIKKDIEIDLSDKSFRRVKTEDLDEYTKDFFKRCRKKMTKKCQN